MLIGIVDPFYRGGNCSYAPGTCLRTSLLAMSPQIAIFQMAKIAGEAPERDEKGVNTAPKTEEKGVNTES